MVPAEKLVLFNVVSVFPLSLSYVLSLSLIIYVSVSLYMFSFYLCLCFYISFPVSGLFQYLSFSVSLYLSHTYCLTHPLCLSISLFFLPPSLFIAFSNKLDIKSFWNSQFLDPPVVFFNLFLCNPRIRNL